MEAKKTAARSPKKVERRYIVRAIFHGDNDRMRHYNFMATDARQAKIKAKHYLANYSLYPGCYELEALLDKSIPMSEAEREFLAKALDA